MRRITLHAIAEFDRARIAERVKLGLARFRSQKKRFCRPWLDVGSDRLATIVGLSVRQAA